jgi:hypothetical protein
LKLVELALNLAWAVIAAASYALLFRRLAIRTAGHARGPSRVQCIIALTCFLAILFPVISLTDDLHEMQATAEEASPSVSATKRCAPSLSSTPAQTLHPVLLIFGPYATNIRWAVSGVVADQRIHSTTPGLHLAAPGRAPPSFAIPQIS